MDSFTAGGRRTTAGRAAWALGAALLAAGGPAAAAQTCTTQARLAPEIRQALADTSLQLASAIKSGDFSRVQALSGAEIAGNFAATSFVLQSTRPVLAGDSLRVTQLYELNAMAHAAGQNAPADFSCPLTGASGEVDFSIEGLGPGVYGFTTVEATGDRPWLLAFLLRQDAGGWRMAGFYPRPRSAAGHDGLWYWQEARRQKAAKPWLAWLDYGLADDLLRPANFVSSTHLDKLRTERSAAAPSQLRDGLSADMPYSLPLAGTAASGSGSVAITALAAAPSDDGRSVHLVLHIRAASVSDPAAARAHSLAAAAALLAAHPEFRTAFDNVVVIAEAAGQPPFALSFPVAEIH